MPATKYGHYRNASAPSFSRFGGWHLFLLILPLTQFLLQTAQEFVFLALGIEKIVLGQLGMLLLERAFQFVVGSVLDEARAKRSSGKCMSLPDGGLRRNVVLA